MSRPLLLLFVLAMGLPTLAGCSRAAPPTPEVVATAAPVTASAAPSTRANAPVPSGTVAAEPPHEVLTLSGHVGKTSAFSMELDRAGERALGRTRSLAAERT